MNPNHVPFSQLNTLDIASQKPLSKVRVKYPKFVKNVQIDHYHFYQKDFFPDLKKLKPLAKAVQKLAIKLTSMGKNSQACFRRTTANLKNFRLAKKVSLVCSTVFIVPDHEIMMILRQMKALKQLKHIHVNFLNSFLTPKSIALIYGFRSIPSVESLVLKLPKARRMQSKPSQALKRVYKRFGESKRLKKKLKDFEVTIDNDEDTTLSLKTSKNTSSALDEEYISILKYLNNIEKLKLNFGNKVLSKLSKDFMKYLENLSQLKALGLRFNNEVLDPNDLDEMYKVIQFLNLSSLELKVCSKQIINSGLCETLNKLSGLKILKLELRHNQLLYDDFQRLIKSFSLLKSLEYFTLKWDLVSNKPTPDFYLQIFNSFMQRAQHLKVLDINYSSGELNQNEINWLVDNIGSMKKLKSFGITAKRIHREVTEKSLKQLFSYLKHLTGLNKLKLNFFYSHEMQSATGALIKSIKKLDNLEKLIVYCPYTNQQKSEVLDFYNSLQQNSSIKVIRIDLPYFEELKYLIKSKPRKLIIKSVYWDFSYRVIYDLYF